MFSFFKKRQSGPRALHRHFARLFIPVSLAPDRRGGFIEGLADGATANERLQKSWDRIDVGLNGYATISPAGLSVSGFRLQKHLGFLIIFPPPEVAGESYFGFVIAGPADEWSAGALNNAAVRYFILERSESKTPVIFEWKGRLSKEEEKFESLGTGPSPADPPDFAESILARCGLI